MCLRQLRSGNHLNLPVLGHGGEQTFMVEGLRVRVQQLMKLRRTGQRHQAQPQGDRPSHPNCSTPRPPIPDSAFRYQAWGYMTPASLGMASAFLDPGRTRWMYSYMPSCGFGWDKKHVYFD